MIDKIKRPKQVAKQDITKPKTVDELIKKYDLENTDIYNYCDTIAEHINSAESDITQAQTAIENTNYDLAQLNADFLLLAARVNDLQTVETTQVTNGSVTIDLARIGKIVFLNIWKSVAVTVQSGTNLLIGTIASGWCPAMNTSIPITIKDSSWNIVPGCALIVRTNGKVELSQTTGANVTTAQILGSCTYYLS